MCFRSLKSLISTLGIDTGFLGFFSGLIMTLTNMNIKLFYATTESDEPRISKGSFPNSMNFDSLSAECDKHDFGLIKYECQKLRSHVRQGQI